MSLSESVRRIGVEPPYWIDYEEFAHPRPADTTADDAMLARLAAKTETLGDLAFYMVHAGSIVQSHQERSLVSLQGLVAAGFALPGREAPAEELCREFTLAQLRAAIGNAGKFRKKADAVEFLTREVRSKLPGVERFFYIKPLSPEDMQAMTAFRWILTHAQLVQVTFRCAEKVAITAALHRGQKGTYYSIAGECCPQSRRDCNPTTRVPANLPPYHIACTAQLEAD